MDSVTSDVIEISNLLKRERFYRDTAQWDLCRAAFHPESSKTYINVAWSVLPTSYLLIFELTHFILRYEGDVDEFLRRSTNMHQGKVNIIHASFDPVDIHVRFHRAISEAFCTITSSITINGIDYELASYMRLATRLEKPSGSDQWRMLSLEAIYVRDRLVSAFPGAAPTSPLLMTDEVQTYPKSYRHLAFVMQARGLSPRPGLPHEDDQESVRAILSRNRSFLNAAEEVVVKD
jgi:hypothetical protein